MKTVIKSLQACNADNRNLVELSKAVNELPTFIPTTNAYKKVLGKVKQFLMGATLGLGLIAHSSAMESPEERAVLNSNEVMEALHSVLPEHLEVTLQMIADRKLRRIAPEYPVVIVEIIEGKVLFYEGQNSLSGAKAQSLVDERGARFGQQIINMGKNSRAGWIGLSLAGKDARGYCAARYPFVACSLLVNSAQNG